LVVITEFFITTRLACGISADEFLAAIHIEIHHIIFRFSNAIWVKRYVTAMGGPLTPAYAQMFYLVHALQL